MMQNSKQLNRKLRKLSVGAASMMIGLTMLGVASANNVAHADEGQSTIPVAAKPTTTATTNSNSTSTTTNNNSNVNNSVNAQQTVNQTIKVAPAGASAGESNNSLLNSEQAKLTATNPGIVSNPSYNASAEPTVVDEQIAHGVYVSTGDSASRTPFSVTDSENEGLSDEAVVNPGKTDELTMHGVITNNSDQTKHVEAVYSLPLDPTNESGSVVYKDITLDDSRFDPSKGITVNGGNNVQVSYAIVGGQYNDIKHLPSNFSWSKVMFITVHADLAAGQSMNVEIPLKIDTSKLNQSLIYGGNKYYWENRFNVGETMFLVNNQYVHKTNLRMRLGVPDSDLNDHIGQYFLMAYVNSDGKKIAVPSSVYEDINSSADANTMKIGNNVHIANFHDSSVDNAILYRQAVNSGDHTVWTGGIYYIDLPAMQKVLTKYGYSFNLNSTNTSVMPYYAYNVFGETTHVQGANGNTGTISKAQNKGITITPDMYIQVHQILAGKDVNVKHGGSWNFLENVAVARNLNGQYEVAIKDLNAAAKSGELSYTGSVDVNKDGDYPITLQLKLADGEKVTTTATVHVVPDVVTTNESHDVTRTINLHHLDGTVATTVQTVHFTRTKTTTDGAVAYTPWTAEGTDSFPRYVIPAIAGYHAAAAGVTVTSIYPVEHVAADALDSVVDI